MAVNNCPQCNTPNRSSASFCSNCGAALLDGVEESSAAPIGQVTLQTGKVLQGRYRIERELGRGGFGAVYRAWDANLKKPCAVKENMDTSPEAKRQFEREATVLANLSHPNLPRVTDHFSIEDQGQYLVMDFVEGEDLDSVMQRQGKVPLEQALKWVTQVADALTYLHSRQPPVVHRDIKPANVRIGPGGQAMLVDFGLVKLYDPHMRTTMGARAVTPGYAPPEQYGRGSTDSRTDVYALGATFYKLITGREPLESVQRMVGKYMTPAQQVNPEIPLPISQVIERAMDLEPDQRFQSAAEFKRALSAPVPRVDATMLVKPAAATQVRPMAQTTVTPSVPSVPSIPAAPPAERRVGIRKNLWLGIVVGIVLILGAASMLGIWIVSEQQKTAEKTADAHFQSTLAERVLRTSTAYAGATATAKARLTTTALAPAAEATAIAPAKGSAGSGPLRVLFSSTVDSDQDDNSDLFILEDDGSITHLIEDEASDFGRGVSPDGNKIAFTSNRSGSWQIFMLDRETNQVQQVTDLDDHARHPAWSPDGEFIAFNSYPESGDGALWFIRADGSDMTKLVDTGRNGRPFWSPDGERLVFNGIHQDTDGNGEIDFDDRWDLFVVNADGSQVVNLTSSPSYDDYVPVWSSDGQWIVFSSVQSDTNDDGQVDRNDNADLYRIRPDGSELSRLTDTPELAEGEPWCTLDGKQIFYIIFGEDANMLWTMNADGSEQKPLLEDYGKVLYPALLP